MVMPARDLLSRRGMVLDHLARAYRDDPDYSIDQAASSSRGADARFTPDLTVTRRHRVVHLFRIVEIRDLELEEAARGWRPLGLTARAMGATFWLLVPCEAVDIAHRLVLDAHVNARLATWTVQSAGGVRFEWL